MDEINRRNFSARLGIAALWPVVARAQPTLPVVGFLGSATAAEWGDLVAAFSRGLEERGYGDGRNLVVEYRWAEDQYDRMPALALDLVARRVDVIAATGGTRSIQAAMAATRTIPIVFVTGGDPIQLRLVASLERPAGNATGVMFSDSTFAPKRLDIIKALVPHARAIATLVNPSNPITPRGLADMSSAAASRQFVLHFLNASTPGEIEQAFATLTQFGADGLIVHADPFLLNQRSAIAALAERHAVATVYGLREFALAGGLMSYGVSILDVFHQAGDYAGRILAGAKPAELPVLQSSTQELVINLRAAKTLGLVVPPSLLASADQVIQ